MRFTLNLRIMRGEENEHMANSVQIVQLLQLLIK